MTLLLFVLEDDGTAATVELNQPPSPIHPFSFLLSILKMHNSPFTVAGMSSSTSSHHNNNTWGTSSSNTSFGESLSQSRSHYQSGYLMVRVPNSKHLSQANWSVVSDSEHG